MSSNLTPRASRTAPAIVPVRPVTAAEDAAATRVGGGLLRRTLGRGHPSRRTFGRGHPSRRTFGRGHPSRRTFGRGNPSRRAFGRNLP
jgi:hypothetical protein